MKSVAFIVGTVLLLGLAHSSVLSQIREVVIAVDGMY